MWAQVETEEDVRAALTLCLLFEPILIFSLSRKTFELSMKSPSLDLAQLICR